MTVYDDIIREFREFTRFTGDGRPGEPVNAPLPVGDPQSGVWNPKKANLRLALGNLAQQLLDGVVLVDGSIPAINSARDAAILAIAEYLPENYEAIRDEVVAALDLAVPAADRAELALDAMLAGATDDIYLTAAEGAADAGIAVGRPFKVVGSGDVSFRTYKKLSSTTYELLPIDQPSAASVAAVAGRVPETAREGFSLKAKSGATVLDVTDDGSINLARYVLKQIRAPGFQVQDPRGFVIAAFSDTGADFLDRNSHINPDPEPEPEFNVGYDASPMIGGTLRTFSDCQCQIYSRQTMRVRSDLSRIRAALWSQGASGARRPSYMVSGDDLLAVDLSKCGPTVTFQARADEVEPDIRHLVQLNAKQPIADGAGQPVKLLMIADSLLNAEVGGRTRDALTYRGYSPTMIGTMVGSAYTADAGGIIAGGEGEGRASWAFEDLTYRLTTYPPVAIGSEAAYLAADREGKRVQNPFIRAATGGDNAAFVKNGYILDFATYASRFGVAAPNLITLGMGTNSVVDAVSDAAAWDIVNDSLNILTTQAWAAWPTARIALYMPSISRSTSRNTRWANYGNMLRAIVRWYLAHKSNPLLDLLPIWAMSSPELGWPLTSSVADAYGVISSDFSDPLHPDVVQRQRVAEILGACAAAVALGQF